MTLVLFYEHGTGLARQVERTGDEDDVVRRDSGQESDRFRYGVRDLSARRRDILRRHGARIVGRGKDHVIGQWKQNRRHFSDRLVAQRTIDDPNAATRVEPANVGGQGARSSGIVGSINNDLWPLGDMLQASRPVRAGYSGG